jgi:hypothetical protein
MTLHGFVNRMKILRFINSWDIEDQAERDGVEFSKGMIDRFIKDPFMTLFAMDEKHQRVIWNLVEVQHFAGAKYRRKIGVPDD